MHLPAAGHFGLADDRNIIFRQACDDAGIAADARVDVDGHAPGVTFVFEARVKRALRFVVMLALGEVGFLPILLQSRGAHQIAPFHAVMELRASQGILRADFTDLRSGPITGRIGSANRIGIEAGAVADLSRAGAAVAEMQGNALVGMARNDPSRSAQASPFVAELDEIGEYPAVLAAAGADLIGQTQPLGSFWTDESSVVPGKLGQRLRQLLQPTVIGEAAVEKRRIGLKRNLQGVSRQVCALAGFRFRVSARLVSGFGCRVSEGMANALTTR